MNVSWEYSNTQNGNQIYHERGLRIMESFQYIMRNVGTIQNISWEPLFGWFFVYRIWFWLNKKHVKLVDVTLYVVKLLRTWRCRDFCVQNLVWLNENLVKLFVGYAESIFYILKLLNTWSWRDFRRFRVIFYNFKHFSSFLWEF